MALRFERYYVLLFIALICFNNSNYINVIEKSSHNEH